MIVPSAQCLVGSQGFSVALNGWQFQHGSACARVDLADFQAQQPGANLSRQTHEETQNKAVAKIRWEMQHAPQFEREQGRSAL